MGPVHAVGRAICQEQLPHRRAAPLPAVQSSDAALKAISKKVPSLPFSIRVGK